MPSCSIYYAKGGISKDGSKWIYERIILHLVIKHKHRNLKVLSEYSAIKTSKTMTSRLTQFQRKEWFVCLDKSLKESDIPICYVPKYTRRPVIADYKILFKDGNIVTFEYHDKALDKKIECNIRYSKFYP